MFYSKFKTCSLHPRRLAGFFEASTVWIVWVMFNSASGVICRRRPSCTPPAVREAQTSMLEGWINSTIINEDIYIYIQTIRYLYIHAFLVSWNKSEVAKNNTTSNWVTFVSLHVPIETCPQQHIDRCRFADSPRWCRHRDVLRNSGHGRGSTRLRKTAGGGVAGGTFLGKRWRHLFLGSSCDSCYLEIVM